MDAFGSAASLVSHRSPEGFLSIKPIGIYVYLFLSVYVYTICSMCNTLTIKKAKPRFPLELYIHRYVYLYIYIYSLKLVISLVFRSVSFQLLWAWNPNLEGHYFKKVHGRYNCLTKLSAHVHSPNPMKPMQTPNEALNPET